MARRIVVADPVADPQSYQRELLSLLGGDDPVAVLAATPSAVFGLVSGLSDDSLKGRPEPAEWSVAELLGHLLDDEIVYAFRARMILAQDAPMLVGNDQDAWATLGRPPFAELLDAFTVLRGANLALIRSGTRGRLGPSRHPRRARPDELPPVDGNHGGSRPCPPAANRTDDRGNVASRR